MSLKKKVKRPVQGWLPKETSLSYAARAVKPRWRKPAWLAFTLIAVIALAYAAYIGVQTYIRYSNPQADVTANYFEKSLNCTTASMGDVIEVTALVNWHGRVLPEFKREVKITDPFPESSFQLVEGNNSWSYWGGGGGDHYKYLLKVTSSDNVSIELPKPRLYLDNTEIALIGASPVLSLYTASEPEK